MTADIRMALENELDQLTEPGIENWLQRCFDSCDPRYDSDWLNGIFELALMQFPDNYEVRAAASKAATMEAQRLYDEGDAQEAISRLERLLESDPYCTDAFELLEKFMQAGSSEPELAPPPEVHQELVVPESVSLQVEASDEPAPAPVAAQPVAEEGDDELLSFLEDDVLMDLGDPILPETPSAPAQVEPIAAEPVVEPEPEAAEAEIATPVVVEPEPVAQADGAPEEVAAPEPVTAAAPVAPAAPVTISVTPPPAAPVALSSTSFDWRSVVGLPKHGSATVEPQLEALLPSLTERFSQIANYRSLVLLLTDLYQRDPQHSGVSQSLNSVLRDWAHNLAEQGRGPEAGQVAAWSQQLLGSNASWAQPVVERFPAELPSLPDLGQFSASSTPGWMSWVSPLRDDPSRFAEAAQALGNDVQGLQSLFRHLAVHHPHQADHVLNLGWAYAQTGQPALAMVHTQRSIQLRPSARAYQLLQRVYTDLGQPEMAQRVAQQQAQLS